MKREEISQNPLKASLEDLRQKAEITDWSIRTTLTKRKNFYLERDGKLESVLDSAREDREIRVFHQEGNQIGESCITLSSGEDDDAVNEALHEAVEIAKTQKNPVYSLPTKDDPEVSESHIDYTHLQDLRYHTDVTSGNITLFINGKIALLKKLIQEAQEPGINVYLNSLELFNTLTTESLVTSQEIEKQFSTQSAYLEVVLSARDISTGEEQEQVLYEPIANLYQYGFESAFKSHIRHTKDALKAKAVHGGQKPVLLSGSAAKDFFVPDLTFSPIIGHCSAKLQYLGIARFKKHERIVSSALEPLHVQLNPLRDDNISRPFDSLGSSGRLISLIEDNTCVAYFGEKRFTDYLGEPSAGPTGIVEVNTGDYEREALLDLSEQEQIEIIHFSSFVPDMVSGTFSAEIRFGYVHHPDGSITPFRGGLFTGNVFSLLAVMRKSKELQNKPGYVGPRAIYFTSASIHSEVD